MTQPDEQTTFQVTVIFDASASITVEASSPEEAAELAEEELHGRQHLCHHCSDSLDTGDAIGSHVYDEDSTTSLLDTTRAGELEREVIRLKREINEWTYPEVAYPEVVGQPL